MKKSIYFFSITFLVVLLTNSTCDIIKNDLKPNEEFIKIIYNPNFESEFYAEDIIQTSDNGFLILGSLHNESNAYVWQSPYLVKLDETGSVLWETTVTSPYVNSVGNIIQIGNEYYFFAMH